MYIICHVKFSRSSKYVHPLYQQWEGFGTDDEQEQETKHLDSEVRINEPTCSLPLPPTKEKWREGASTKGGTNRVMWRHKIYAIM